ncbi:MAG: hypothetical protein ACLP01_18440 [Solirubrobacteraceae bacterium]
MTVVAFVRPADDAAAAEIGAWGDDVRRIALAAKATVIDRVGSANTRRVDVDQVLIKSADHVLWFGHGRDDALVANSVPVVDVANIGYLQDGVLIAIACDSANRLGPDAVRIYGVRTFLGFDDHLGWPAQAPGPMRDAVVQGLDCLFSQQHDLDYAANQLRRELVGARLEYEINGANYGLSAGEATTAWLFAKSNAASVRMYGDGSATLV